MLDVKYLVPISMSLLSHHSLVSYDSSSKPLDVALYLQQDMEHDQRYLTISETRERGEYEEMSNSEESFIQQQDGARYLNI